MTYLAQQIVWCLIAAALIGLVVGWLLARMVSRRRHAALAASAAHEREALRDATSRLQGEVEKARSTNSNLEAELDGVRQELAAATDATSDKKDVAGQLADCRRNLETRESELNACREARASLEEHLVQLREQIDTLRGRREVRGDRGTEGEPPSADAGTGRVSGLLATRSGPARRDDLTRIEGIGPKIAQLLNEADIRTWAELAETDVARLRQVLEDAGPRFALHRPDSWPRQARLAHEGRFEELARLQDHLDGGKEPD